MKQKTTLKHKKGFIVSVVSGVRRNNVKAHFT